MTLAGQVQLLATRIGQETKPLKPLTARTTVAATTTLTTYGTVTGLTVTVAAGKTYRLKARGQYRTAATTTGIGLRLGGTATTTGIRYETFIYGLTATTYTALAQSALGVAAVPTTGVLAATTDYPFLIDGLVRVNTAGTITLDFASEVSGSVVTVQPDAYLWLEE